MAPAARCGSASRAEARPRPLRALPRGASAVLAILLLVAPALEAGTAHPAPAFDAAPGLRSGTEFRQAALETTGRPIGQSIQVRLEASRSEAAGVRLIRLLEKDDPLGLLDVDEETGAWEVAEGKGDTFDGVFRESQRLTDQQLSDAMEATKDYPEFWQGGRPLRFSPAELPRAAQAYADMRGFGIPDGGDVAVIGETSARVENIASVLDRNGFSVRTFTSDEAFEVAKAKNEMWIREQMAAGIPIIDIGLDPFRVSRGPFYALEDRWTTGYWNRIPYEW
jgi:hypothetical protein